MRPFLSLRVSWVFEEVTDPQNGQQAFDSLHATGLNRVTLPAKSTLRRSNRAAPRPLQYRAEADASQPETSVARERRPKRKAAEQCLIMDSSSTSDCEAVTEVESDKQSEMSDRVLGQKLYLGVRDEVGKLWWGRTRARCKTRKTVFHVNLLGCTDI